MKKMQTPVIAFVGTLVGLIAVGGVVLRTQIDPVSGWLEIAGIHVGAAPPQDAGALLLAADMCSPRLPDGSAPPAELPEDAYERAVHTVPPVTQLWLGDVSVDYTVVAGGALLPAGRSAPLWMGPFSFVYVDWRRMLPSGDSPGANALESVFPVAASVRVQCNMSTVDNGTLCETPPASIFAEGDPGGAQLWPVRLLCGGAEIVLPPGLFFALFSAHTYPTLVLDFAGQQLRYTPDSYSMQVTDTGGVRVFVRPASSQRGEDGAAVLLGSIALRTTAVAIDLFAGSAYATQHHVPPQHVPNAELVLALILLTVAILWDVADPKESPLPLVALTAALVVGGAIFAPISQHAGITVWLPLVLSMAATTAAGRTTRLALVACPLYVAWLLIAPSQYEWGVAIAAGLLILLAESAVLMATVGPIVLVLLGVLAWAAYWWIAQLAWHLYDDVLPQGVRRLAVGGTFSAIVAVGVWRGRFLASHGQQQ